MDDFLHAHPPESAYTPSQASAWLRHIRLPTQYASSITSPSSFPQTPASLRALFRCQITTFPYENLSVHYSPSHVVDIDPAALYEKLMGPNSNRRGGYCMELSIFFHHMLRALGFFVYMAGVRNRTRIDGVPQGEYQGWTHINNIIHLPDGSKYSADVGFGGDGPTSPLCMDGRATALQNLGAQQIRLVHDHMPKQRLRAPKAWIYQYRNGVDREWNSYYCFQEFEFFQEDFAVQNLWTSTGMPHRGIVMAVRFLREGEPVEMRRVDDGGDQLSGEEERGSVDDEEGNTDGKKQERKKMEEEAKDNDEEEVKIVGKVMLVNNVIKVNLGGRTSVVHEFDSETGRYDALARYFGIELTDEEKAAIRGWHMELK